MDRPAAAPCSGWNLGFWVVAYRILGRVEQREACTYAMLEG
jgi:hypothetical protein